MSVFRELTDRDSELTAQAEAFRGAAGGRRAVVVTGEAGIGKSRLVAESLADLDATELVLRPHPLRATYSDADHEHQSSSPRSR